MSVVSNLKGRALESIVAGMSAADRYALAKRLVAEMPQDDRQRLMAHSPGFVLFARAFLLAAGQQRPAG